MAKIWPERLTKLKQTSLLFIWLRPRAHCYNFWLSNYRVITQIDRAGTCCIPRRVRTGAFPWTSSTGLSPIVQAWLKAGEDFCNVGCFLSTIQWKIYGLHLVFSPRKLPWVSSATLIRLVQVMWSVWFIFPKQKTEVLWLYSIFSVWLLFISHFFVLITF